MARFGPAGGVAGRSLQAAGAWFARFKTLPAWAIVISLVNVAGIAYGFALYLPQLAATPLPLWLFAPDSPLAVLWAQAALGAYWLHRARGGRGEAPGFGAALLDSLAVIGTLQMGAWATYVLVAREGAFATFGPQQGAALLVGHLAMTGVPLLFLEGVRERARLRPRVQWAAIGLAWAFYLVQDALDYLGPDYLGRGCGMRPHMVPCAPETEIALSAAAFGLTLAGALLLAAVAWPARAASVAAADAPAA